MAGWFGPTGDCGCGCVSCDAFACQLSGGSATKAVSQIVGTYTKTGASDAYTGWESVGVSTNGYYARSWTRFTDAAVFAGNYALNRNPDVGCDEGFAWYFPGTIDLTLYGSTGFDVFTGCPSGTIDSFSITAQVGVRIGYTALALTLGIAFADTWTIDLLTGEYSSSGIQYEFTPGEFLRGSGGLGFSLDRSFVQCNGGSLGLQNPGYVGGNATPDCSGYGFSLNGNASYVLNT